MILPSSGKNRDYLLKMDDQQRELYALALKNS
jgi:hypothetical protein